MNLTKLMGIAIPAIVSVTLSRPLMAQMAKQPEFKLPPPTRYLTDEQIEKLTAQTEKIEIKPNEYTPKLLKYFHAEVKTAFGGTSYERQILDITQSYFGLTIGDKVDDVVANPGKYLSDRKFFVGLNVKVSSAPAILEGMSKTKVHEAVREKVKQGAVAAAAIAVRNGFEQNVHPMVAAGALTEADYQAMLAKNIKETTTAVGNNNQLIDKLASPFIKEADRRVNAVADEIILQEVSAKFAWSPMADDSIIIFGTVGKAQINGNMKPNQGVRANMAFGGFANIGNTTQGTGVIHMGVQTAVANDIKVTLESWVFHNRLPTRSGQTLLFNVTAMPIDIFENHQDITRLDSNMQKITVEIPSKVAPVNDTIYFTTGDFKGQRAYGAGAIIRVLPKISIQVEGSTGREALYSSAVMEAILYHVNDKLTLYVANENVHNLMSAYNVEAPKVTPGQVGAASIGAGYSVGKWSLGYDVTAAINATAAFKCFYKNEGMYDQDQCGVDAGMSANVQWQ